jgi:hypothetical protein
VPSLTPIDYQWGDGYWFGENDDSPPDFGESTRSVQVTMNIADVVLLLPTAGHHVT